MKRCERGVAQQRDLTGEVLKRGTIMKRTYALGLIISAVFACGAGSIRAETIAVGPYYANPSWDQTLPAATRFIVLSNMGGEAVLDRETGLVWEKSPSTSKVTWVSATFLCANKTVGGRRGWRLPSFVELMSLLDPSVSSGAALPAGHPFQNVPPSDNNYWSATTSAANPDAAWEVPFFPNGTAVASSKSFNGLLVWCVRGAMNADAY